jgi:protein phosphatase PTC7
MVLRPTLQGAGRHGTYKLTLAFHSTFQWHYFNCPLQLGIDVDGANDKFDTPAAAEVFSVPVQVGDIILLCTDGIYDNVTDDQLISMAEEYWLKNYAVDEISQAIANRAFEISQDKMIDTPFSIMAREENILWRGGRPDDITIIVAKVEG